MSDNADYLYALELQNRLNAESDSDAEVIDFKLPKKCNDVVKFKRNDPYSNLDEHFLNRTENLVHPEWETLDPTPDVQALFRAFDNKFFQSRLKCVTLEWSKKMYSCAGICYCKRNKFGREVTIRLSEPLLKLRSRKNLLETLLHEMIHAYCFVLNIREGNGGHGPQFKKIMFAINKVAGTNITVYHTFYDEVEIYKQHWWRCNGVCQSRSPFFGYVKRTSNRAPGPNDQWWAAHMHSCSGTFMKIKGPDNPKKGKIKKEISNTKKGQDIRGFFDPKKKAEPVNGPIKSNGGGTILLDPTKGGTKTMSGDIARAFPPTSYPGLSSDPFNANTNSGIKSHAGNVNKIVGLRDLNANEDEDSGGGNIGSSFFGRNTTNNNNSLSGRGFTLNGSESNTNSVRELNRDHLRSMWSARFPSTQNSSTEDATALEDNAKRQKISEGDASDSDCVCVTTENEPVANKWVIYDDDIMLKEKLPDIISLSSDSSDESSDESNNDNSITKPMDLTELSAHDRQIIIKNEILTERTDLEDSEIILIDDEYDDNHSADDLTAAAEIADSSIIDEFFGDDTLLKEFNNENDLKGSGSHYVLNPNRDIITCPICQDKMQRHVLQEHLDGCMGISIKVKPSLQVLKKITGAPNVTKPPRSSNTLSSRELLLRAGYTENDIANIPSTSSSTPRLYRQRNIYKNTRQCPKCGEEIENDMMNSHIIQCTKQRTKKPIKKQTKQNCPYCLKNLDAADLCTHMVNCLDNMGSSNSESDTTSHRKRNLYKTTHQCPNCALEVEEDAMESHKNECFLKKRRMSEKLLSCPNCFQEVNDNEINDHLDDCLNK